MLYSLTSGSASKNSCSIVSNPLPPSNNCLTYKPGAGAYHNFSDASGGR